MGIKPDLTLSKSGKVAENLHNTTYSLHWGCRGRGFESRRSDQIFSYIVIFPAGVWLACPAVFFLNVSAYFVTNAHHLGKK
jgi:hypothetical protein